MKNVSIENKKKSQRFKQDDKELSVAEKVALDLHKQSSRKSRKHHGRKSTRDAGKAKGHKWKQSELIINMKYY